MVVKRRTPPPKETVYSGYHCGIESKSNEMIEFGLDCCDFIDWIPHYGGTKHHCKKYDTELSEGSGILPKRCKQCRMENP